MFSLTNVLTLAPSPDLPRTLPLFLRALEERGPLIPRPDALVCGVGTRIYTPVPGPGREEPAGACVCELGRYGGKATSRKRSNEQVLVM